MAAGLFIDYFLLTHKVLRFLASLYREIIFLDEFMKLDEYSSYDGLGLAELIRKKDVTSIELIELAVNGANGLNGKLNAILEIFVDRLQKRSSDLVTSTGLFQGVPFLLKDSGAGEFGRKQEMGSHLCAGNHVGETGYIIEKFLQSGMVSLGRTAVPEFCMSYSTESPVHGVTRNPWDLAYSAGGSSGGSCASVSSGIVPIAHGNDSAGSIRMPASCCNLVGLKPSRGRTSIGPGESDFPSGLNTEFAVTKTIRDCAALLDVAEGPGIDEVRTLAAPKDSYLSSINLTLPRLKVAVCLKSLINQPIHDEVYSVVKNSAKLLEELGHVVDEDYYDFNYSEFQYHDCNYLSAFTAANVRRLGKGDKGCDVNKLDTLNKWFYDQGVNVGGVEVLAALDAYNGLRQKVNRFFNHYDVLITPTIMSLPEKLPIENTFHKWASSAQYLVPVNVAGNPAISLPLGVSKSGLPIGVQIVSRFGDEKTLLQLGRIFENRIPWNNRRPKVHVANIK